MKKTIITNLLMLVSFISMGQIYKCEKKLSPGDFKYTTAIRNVDGILMFMQDNNLCQYKNGLFSAFPKVPVSTISGDSLWYSDIEIFNDTIFLSGYFENYNSTTSTYGLLYFDGSAWKPVAAFIGRGVSSLTNAGAYLYGVSDFTLFKMNSAFAKTDLVTSYGMDVRAFNKTEIIFQKYESNKIYKYDGSNLDSLVKPKALYYSRSISSGDTDVYFQAYKYIYKLHSSFTLQFVDSSNKDLMTSGVQIMGLLDDHLIFNHYDGFPVRKRMEFNIKTSTYEELIGDVSLQEYTYQRYQLIDYGIMYTMNYNKYALAEVLDGVLISGSVYEDLNINCKKNAGEKPITKIKISFTDTTHTNLAIANDTGYYKIVIPPGTFSIKVENKYLQTKYDSCGGNNKFNLGTNYTANIPFRITPNVKDISGVILGNNAFKARRGFVNDYTIAYENFGYGPENFTFELEYPDSLTFKTSSISPASHVGRKLTFTVSNVKRYEKGKISLSFELHSKKQLKSKLKFVLNTFPKTGDLDTTNNTDTLTQTCVAAFDPNIKESFPEGVVESPVSKIRYNIHFQNEGTYYATRVIVVDTFDGKLPLTKVQMLGSKHPYKLRVEKNNVLIWEFENINLVPKSQSEEGSKGFIAFEAPLSKPLGKGEIIKNRAHIYFDYEDPVRTAAAVVSYGPYLSVNPELEAKYKIKVYPNPVSNSFSINGENRLGEIAIYNALGELVYAINSNNLSESINTEGWSTGIYFIKFTDKGLTLKIIKL